MFDAIVIGGSYAGLSAAMQLARARRKVLVIDAGQPRNRFAAASHGFFGQDGAQPAAMIATAREKLLAYPSVTFAQDQAVEARKENASFRVELASGEAAQGAKLVLAFGVQDNLPTIPGLKERWGQSVLHCPYCHGFEFGDKNLGVLNVGPLSAHQALLIADWGPVTFFLNGHEMPDAETVAKLQARGITIEPEPILALEGASPALSGLRLADGRLVAIDALYLASQVQMNSPVAEQLGCAFDDGPFGPFIRVDAANMTTVPGVYAAGDIARIKHNATFASADGVTAGVSLHQALIFEPLAQ